MLKKTFFAVALALLAAGLTGRAAAQQQVMIDKIAAVVGNSIILYSEVEETSRQLQEMKRERGYTSDRNPKIEALEELMRQKLLYNQALIDSVDINKAYAAEQADEYLTKLVARAGSVPKLEAQFSRPVFDIKRELVNRFEEQQYAQNMRRELISKVTITPGEVDRFYKNLPKDSLPVIPPQYVYKQITKLPLSTNDAKLRAREQLLELRERIVGGTRFDILARMYSEDGSAARGGELEPMPAENFEAPFARALEKLRPGQVSEVVETVYGFHIIELIAKNGNLYHARHILVRPQFTEVEMAATSHTLDSLASAIRADSTTFEKAALAYSDDKYSKLNGGLVSNLEMLEVYSANDASYATTKHFKDDLPVDDFRSLDKLQPGEISRAFVTQDMRGNKMSKIVKLIEIIPAHPANMEEDYLQVEMAALNQKREKEFEQWLDKKISTMYVRVEPEFLIPSEFENPDWLK